MKKHLLSIFALLLPVFIFAQNTQEKGLDQKIDEAFQPVADGFFNAIFFPIYKSETMEIPFVLVLLVGSALFFTLYFKFPNIRFFGKAINVVRGKYDDIDHSVVEPAYGDSTPGGDSIETIRDESEEG